MSYSLGLYEKAMPNTLSFPEKLELTARCVISFPRQD